MSENFTVFVSSRMVELANERSAIRSGLQNVGITAWVYETDAGARTVSIETTYLKALANARLFVGIYWRGYGTYTVEEFEVAQRSGKPCLLYEIETDSSERDAQLEAFLRPLRQVRQRPAMRPIKRRSELRAAVVRDVVTWLQDQLRVSDQRRGPIYLSDHFPQREFLRERLSASQSMLVLSHGRTEQAHHILSQYCYHQAREAGSGLSGSCRIRWPLAGSIPERFEALTESMIVALDELDGEELPRIVTPDNVRRRLSNRRDRPCLRIPLAVPNAYDIAILEQSLKELWIPAHDSGSKFLLIFEFEHSWAWFWQSASWRRFRECVRLLESHCLQSKASLVTPPRILNLSQSDVVRITVQAHGSEPRVENDARALYARHRGRVGPTLRSIYDKDEI
jgi:hypothetical protein